ncbi:MAG TPA: LysR family transcriptional regulator [Leucothrix mucor]|uniref:LysR family transcriptional regulator n=1 Tax=Leucothrix mucor TaxID=45248 RepID=A0A7V2SZ97_LEUMU|nr:LysR family transcriptional regulator [Leucothrix mucor]
MKLNLEIDMLRTFRAVHEQGGFTQAARHLYLTQSTVSHKIMKLEKQIERKLFHRTTRRATLTPEGKILLSEAQEILALVDATESRIAGSQLSGNIRLGIPEEFACGQLPDLLAKFRIKQPNVKLEVNVGIGQDLEKSVKNNQLDFAIIKKVTASTNSLARQPMKWVGLKGLTNRKKIPVAFFPKPCIFRETAIKALNDSNIDYEIVLTTTSHQSLYAAARSGFAITVMAESDCPKELVVPKTWKERPNLPLVSYVFCHQKNRAKPVQALQKLIKEQLKERISH